MLMLRAIALAGAIAMLMATIEMVAGAVLTIIGLAILTVLAFTAEAALLERDDERAGS